MLRLCSGYRMKVDDSFHRDFSTHLPSVRYTDGSFHIFTTTQADAGFYLPLVNIVSNSVSICLHKIILLYCPLI